MQWNRRRSSGRAVWRVARGDTRVGFPRGVDSKRRAIVERDAKTAGIDDDPWSFYSPKHPSLEGEILGRGEQIILRDREGAIPVEDDAAAERALGGPGRSDHRGVQRVATRVLRDYAAAVVQVIEDDRVRIRFIGLRSTRRGADPWREACKKDGQGTAVAAVDRPACSL